MTESPNTSYELTFRTAHSVGYAIEKDAIFEYWIEGDLIYYFSPPVTDAPLVTPIDYVNLDKLIFLGEL